MAALGKVVALRRTEVGGLDGHPSEYVLGRHLSRQRLILKPG